MENGGGVDLRHNSRPHRTLDVVFCWHMHQPQYLVSDNSGYEMPWVYLHGIKDYTDMAAHLEAVPAARAVINFSPVLLEQLTDYAKRIASWVRHGVPIGDPLLDALREPVSPGTEQRESIIRACLRAHKTHMIERFVDYAERARRAEAELAGSAARLDDAALHDLVVWYHLAWMGESLRRENAFIRSLIEKGSSYTLDERFELTRRLGQILADLLPRYRRLAERGQIELCVSPYAHAMLPLLIDFNCAAEADPESRLPGAGYPDGYTRSEWHTRRAIEVFEKHFGFRPSGCWPSEGGLSDAVLRLLEGCGFSWTASGTNVLKHSLGYDDELAPYWVWKRAGVNVACFFRDDELSDLIGFSYARWKPEDAVADLVRRLERISDAATDDMKPVVSIILDGENVWEYFPNNGFFFLQELYQQCSEHPRVNLTTFSDVLSQRGHFPNLSHVVAGSWVAGNFSLWVGHAEKNRAWELLCAAREALDQKLRDSVFTAEDTARILKQLSVCEGSDWFWWLGDDNDAESTRQFDTLFRRQLSRLYTLASLPVPAELGEPIVQSHKPSSRVGTIRKANP